MQNNANEMAVFNTAIYVRLSKEDIVAAQSGRESNSITNQKQLILDFLKDKPEFNIVSIRIDDGYTGTNFDRPAFQRMLNDIKAGRINCVVVKDLSRFGREYINSGKYIHRLFPVLGVRLIAINDNIDTITRDESSEFSITLKNLMNDNYSRDISVKVRSQLQVKRKHGDFICPFAPYGYQKCEGNHNRIEPDPYAATVVQDIFNWKIQGMTNNGIAIRLAESGILAPLEYKRHKKEKEKYSAGFGSKMQWALLVEKYKDQESIDAEMAAAFIETLTLFNDGHVEVAFRHRDEIEQVLYVAATRGKEAERYAG